MTQEKTFIILMFWLVMQILLDFFTLYSHSVVVVAFIGTAAAVAAKSLQSCLTLCDPIDGSPPGSAVPGILQARTLE